MIQSPYVRYLSASLVIKKAPNTLVLNVFSNCSVVISSKLLQVCCSAELLTIILILLNLLLILFIALIQNSSLPISPLSKIHSPSNDSISSFVISASLCSFK